MCLTITTGGFGDACLNLSGDTGFLIFVMTRVTTLPLSSMNFVNTLYSIKYLVLHLVTYFVVTLVMYLVAMNPKPNTTSVYGIALYISENHNRNYGGEHMGFTGGEEFLAENRQAIFILAALTAVCGVAYLIFPSKKEFLQTMYLTSAGLVALGGFAVVTELLRKVMEKNTRKRVLSSSS